MTGKTATFQGVVRGKTIELDRAPALPEGEQVTVVVQRRAEADRQTLTPAESLERAFGTWADNAEEVDQFLEQLRRDRDQDDRADLAP